MKNEKRPMMACGHVALGTDRHGKPYCPICSNFQVVEELPNIQDKKSKCIFCEKTVKSDFDLPFFEHKEDQEHDSYYCGCEGWD